MTVPYQTKIRNIQTIFTAQPGKMPTIVDAYDWLNEPKPSDEVTRLKYENEALQREVDHQKQTLVNYQNNVSLYTDDYKRLDIDYKNSVHENRQLQAMIEKYEHTEEMNVMLMKQVIELKERLSKYADR